MIAVAPKRITNKAAIAALRTNARIHWVSQYPLKAWVKSPMSGDVHTVVSASDETLICITCAEKYGRETCWVQEKVRAALPGFVAAVVARQEPEPEPEPKEPKKVVARSWGAIYREQLTLVKGGKEDV